MFWRSRHQESQLNLAVLGDPLRSRAGQEAMAARNSKPVRDMSRRINLQHPADHRKRKFMEYFDLRPRDAVAITMKRSTTSQHAMMACTTWFSQPRTKGQCLRLQGIQCRILLLAGV